MELVRHGMHYAYGLEYCKALKAYVANKLINKFIKKI